MFDFNDDEKKRLSYWLKQCDAIVITGGYHPTDYDYYVLEYALKHDLPILGICLGMQVMATYKSKEQLKLIGNNSHLQDNSDYSHYIDIEQDSHLSMILGNNDHIKVNSRHLEYVNSGGLFKVVAKSDDGLVEAIENPNHPFQIGVQWHPESMISYDDKQAKLWQTFIEIASRTCK